MPVLLAIFALAVLGLSLLAKPADRAYPRPVQETTTTTAPQQDWHGNYNMVRRYTAGNGRSARKTELPDGPQERAWRKLRMMPASSLDQ